MTNGFLKLSKVHFIWCSLHCFTWLTHLLHTHTHTHMSYICRTPLEIHKHLMRVSWAAARLTLLTPLSYCHTPRRMPLTVVWQGGDNSVCVWVCVRGSTRSYLRNLGIWTLSIFTYVCDGADIGNVGVRLWLRMCLYVCLCVHVWGCGCSTWLSSAWAGQSLICHPLRSTDTQPKQTDIKTERKASLCSSAVQFVLTLSGASLLSADSNELPGD